LGHYHLGTRTEKATIWVLKLLGHYHLGTRTKKATTWVLKLLGQYHLGTRVDRRHRCRGSSSRWAQAGLRAHARGPSPRPHVIVFFTLYSKKIIENSLDPSNVFHISWNLVCFTTPNMLNLLCHRIIYMCSTIYIS
jgi:hypothetical protein